MKPSEMAMVVDNAKETFLSARDDLAETDVGKKVAICLMSTLNIFSCFIPVSREI